MSPGTCFECGAAAAHDHHVVPRSLGGVRTVPLCVRCHSLVHASSLVAAQGLSRAGLERRRTQGRQPNGSPAYGWRWVDGDVVPCPDEQAVIAHASKLRAAGMTWREVTERINEMGYRARGGRPFRLNKLCERVRAARGTN